MAIPIPTVDDFTESTVMQECRRIVEYIIDTIVPAINEGGGGSSYVLPPATKSTLGGIIVGDNLTVDGSGKVNAPAPYKLPIGGTNIGGVKNGGNVTIESDGTMNASVGSDTPIIVNSINDLLTQLQNTDNNYKSIFAYIKINRDRGYFINGIITNINYILGRLLCNTVSTPTGVESGTLNINGLINNNGVLSASTVASSSSDLIKIDEVVFAIIK